MNKDQNQTVVILNLSAEEDNFEFSTSIEEAIEQSEIEGSKINETFETLQNLKPECDKLDYIISVSSGILCGIFDIFLVGAPKESVLKSATDKWVKKKVVDLANLFQKKGKKFEYNQLPAAISSLEGNFKVNYDQRSTKATNGKVEKLNSFNHHQKSLGHNFSILGLFFSILDQYTGKSHFISNGKLISIESTKNNFIGETPIQIIFEAFKNWFGHLISDVSGSSSSARNKSRGMGIPSPFTTWVNDLIVIKDTLNIPDSKFFESLNEIAIKIYKQGADMRFLAVQAIPVILNELIIRFCYSVRRLFKYFATTKKEERNLKLMWEKCEPFSNPTVKRMLTVAHGSFCVIDLGDAIIRGLMSKNIVDCILRINVPGIGRIMISIKGEVSRAINYSAEKINLEYIENEKRILLNYVSGLRMLAETYDDTYLLRFVNDFESSDTYLIGFSKSIELAEKREVGENKILKNKNDIDEYFGG